MTNHNAADEDLTREMEEKRKRERIDELNDIRFMLNSPQGRRFLQRFFSKWGLLRNAMTGNSQTYFNLGSQNVAQWLFSEVCTAGTTEQIGEIMFVKEKEESDGR